jgi:hypothetical protein
MDNDTIVCWMIWESLAHHPIPHFHDAVQQQYRVEMSDVFSLFMALTSQEPKDVPVPGLFIGALKLNLYL